MALIKNAYEYIEEIAYHYMIDTLKYNLAVTCGILANISAESSFNPRAVGDGGKAYGLCQWNDRRDKLFSYTKTSNPSTQQQLDFMKYELSTLESKAGNALVNITSDIQGAYNAAYQFCVLYERPSNKESKGRERGELAKKYFTYYNSDYVGITKYVGDVGHTIVEIAREQLGKKYEYGKWGYDSNLTSFDDVGLVQYCYAEAGSPMEILSDAEDILNYYQQTGKGKLIDDPDDIAAGDILLYESRELTLEEAYSAYNEGVFHRNELYYYLTEVLEEGQKIKFRGIAAIANGSGGKIYASRYTGTVIEETNMNHPDTAVQGTYSYILRIISDSETSKGDIQNAIDYISLTSYDPYGTIVSNNLRRIYSSSDGYGHLIDMDHGGEFKFYIPEFSESAGAKWSDVEIRGRSVSIKAYESTTSRSISISLELYAGAGLYYAPVPPMPIIPSNVTDEERKRIEEERRVQINEILGETVDKLHRDVNFVKSLEYPDYSNIIVQPPATVHLVLGSNINLVGVVSDVVVEHMKPLDAQSRSMYVKLSFKVTQTAVNPPDYKNIREGQYSSQDSSSIGEFYRGSILK